MKGGRAKRQSHSQFSHFIQDGWEAVLCSLDSRVLRRAKAALKQGDLPGEVSVRADRIVLPVRHRGPEKRNGTVSLPLFDDWTTYAASVATWLYRRPDWLASLMAGHWDEEFVQFVVGTGLSLCPNPDALPAWLAEARCDCDDFERPCRHTVALLVQMAATVTEQPLHALEFVGLDVGELLDEAHRLTAHHVLGDNAPFCVETTDAGGGAVGLAGSGLWLEERAAFSAADIAQSHVPTEPASDRGAHHAAGWVHPAWDEGRMQHLRARLTQDV